ncbi:hypothetical protein [Natranaerobius trueperi]|uniref:hypothetical protein n=1 Tax=Natranaerobius trueperi TaxID=759412 RepID=UPI00130338CF|nr:hypothetical protein [Natranaerobius trueperi]
MERKSWEIVLIGMLGHKERILDTGLSYDKALNKYNYLKRSKIDNNGTLMIRKVEN